MKARSEQGAMAEADPQSAAGSRAPPAPRRQRWGWLDFVLLVLVALVFGYMAWNTTVVLKYRWDWSSIWPFVFRLDAATGRWVPNIIFEGLLTTLRLAVWGILLRASSAP